MLCICLHSSDLNQNYSSAMHISKISENKVAKHNYYKDAR